MMAQLCAVRSSQRRSTNKPVGDNAQVQCISARFCGQLVNCPQHKHASSAIQMETESELSHCGQGKYTAGQTEATHAAVFEPLVLLIGIEIDPLLRTSPPGQYWAAMDESICRTRVVTQDWAGAQASVKKCATAFFSFLNAWQAQQALSAAEMGSGAAPDTPSAGPTAAAAHEKLLLELAQYELVMTQLSQVERRCREEVEHYRGVNATIDAAIARTTAELGDLKQQLEEERVGRERKREYEATAKEVNRVRSRAELQALLDAVEADYASTAAEGRELDALLERRRVQFAVVLAGINDLQRLFEEEQEADRRKTAAIAAAAAYARAQAAGEAAGTSAVAGPAAIMGGGEASPGELDAGAGDDFDAQTAGRSGGAAAGRSDRGLDGERRGDKDEASHEPEGEESAGGSGDGARGVSPSAQTGAGEAAEDVGRGEDGGAEGGPGASPAEGEGGEAQESGGMDVVEH